MIHPHVKIIVQNHIKVDDMSEIMSVNNVGKYFKRGD